MPMQLLFWVLMLMWAVVRIAYLPKPIGPSVISEVVLFVLLLLLGWHVYGPAVTSH